MGEYLNFQEISTIPFKTVLDHFNVKYDEREGEIVSKHGIVNIKKNLYLNPQNKEEKGSVINFTANLMQTDLRSAASHLKKSFMEEPKPKEIPEYQLHYHNFLADKGISEELAQEFEVGYVKSRGIMAGKIAVEIRDETGEKVAYIGRNIKPGASSKYFFFKGYKNNHLYNLWRVKSPNVILTVSPFDVIHIHQLGFPDVVGLISHNMTEAQENLLGRFTRIFILHPSPQNIVNRLSRFAFVKAPEIDTVQSLTRDDIDTLF